MDLLSRCRTQVFLLKDYAYKHGHKQEVETLQTPTSLLCLHGQSFSTNTYRPAQLSDILNKCSVEC